VKEQQIVPLFTVLIITSFALLFTVLIVALQFRTGKRATGEQTPLADSIYAEISELRLGSSIGEGPPYFVLLIPD
jgi:hypothetical protein